jgi:hypothetical protein
MDVEIFARTQGCEEKELRAFFPGKELRKQKPNGTAHLQRTSLLPPPGGSWRLAARVWGK